MLGQSLAVMLAAVASMAVQANDLKLITRVAAKQLERNLGPYESANVDIGSFFEPRSF